MSTHPVPVVLRLPSVDTIPAGEFTITVDYDDEYSVAGVADSWVPIRYPAGKQTFAVRQDALVSSTKFWSLLDKDKNNV